MTQQYVWQVCRVFTYNAVSHGNAFHTGLLRLQIVKNCFLMVFQIRQLGNVCETSD